MMLLNNKNPKRALKVFLQALYKLLKVFSVKGQSQSQIQFKKLTYHLKTLLLSTIMLNTSKTNNNLPNESISQFPQNIFRRIHPSPEKEK